MAVQGVSKIERPQRMKLRNSSALTPSTNLLHGRRDIDTIVDRVFRKLSADAPLVQPPQFGDQYKTFAFQSTPKLREFAGRLADLYRMDNPALFSTPEEKAAWVEQVVTNPAYMHTVLYDVARNTGVPAYIALADSLKLGSAEDINQFMASRQTRIAETALQADFGANIVNMLLPTSGAAGVARRAIQTGSMAGGLAPIAVPIAANMSDTVRELYTRGIEDQMKQSGALFDHLLNLADTSTQHVIASYQLDTAKRTGNAEAAKTAESQLQQITQQLHTLNSTTPAQDEDAGSSALNDLMLSAMMAVDNTADAAAAPGLSAVMGSIRDGMYAGAHLNAYRSTKVVPVGTLGNASGQVLAQSYGQFPVGTPITPELLAALQSGGVKDVAITDHNTFAQTAASMGTGAASFVFNASAAIVAQRTGAQIAAHLSPEISWLKNTKALKGLGKTFTRMSNAPGIKQVGQAASRVGRVINKLKPVSATISAIRKATGAAQAAEQASRIAGTASNVARFSRFARAAGVGLKGTIIADLAVQAASSGFDAFYYSGTESGIEEHHAEIEQLWRQNAAKGDFEVARDGVLDLAKGWLGDIGTLRRDVGAYVMPQLRSSDAKRKARIERETLAPQRFQEQRVKAYTELREAMPGVDPITLNQLAESLAVNRFRATYGDVRGSRGGQPVTDMANTAVDQMLSVYPWYQKLPENVRTRAVDLMRQMGDEAFATAFLGESETGELVPNQNLWDALQKGIDKPLTDSSGLGQTRRRLLTPEQQAAVDEFHRERAVKRDQQLAQESEANAVGRARTRLQEQAKHEEALAQSASEQERKWNEVSLANARRDLAWQRKREEQSRRDASQAAAELKAMREETASMYPGTQSPKTFQPKVTTPSSSPVIAAGEKPVPVAPKT